MNNLQYFVPFRPDGLCLEVCLGSVKENYLSIRGQVVIPKNQEQRQKRFSLEVDQTFLNMHAKKLVKVTGTGEIKCRKRPPTLRKLSFKFHHQNSVVEARFFNYANNCCAIINMDDIRQEKSNEGPTLKLNKRFK